MTQKGLNPEPKAFAACIDGVIPPAAGVSSSSAFVVASALATLRLHEVDIAKKELAAMCTTCECVSRCSMGANAMSLAPAIHTVIWRHAHIFRICV